MIRPRTAGAVLDDRAGDHRAEQLRALRKVERIERAAHGIEQAQARRVNRRRCAHLELRDIVRDVDEDAVRFGTDVGAHGFSTMCAVK